MTTVNDHKGLRNQNVLKPCGTAEPGAAEAAPRRCSGYELVQTLTVFIAPSASVRVL